MISGVFELLGAAGLLLPKYRRLAGSGLILLYIAVFPANINMALHSELFPEIPTIVLYLRLPLQLLIVFVIWLAIKPKVKMA